MDQNKTEESRDLDLCRNWLEALRQELLEQGELLALLEKQRSALELDGGLSLVLAIKEADHQFHVVLAAQAKSVAAERAVLEQGQLRESLPLQELLARLPAACRPAIRALRRENMLLKTRVEQRLLAFHQTLRESINALQPLLSSSPQSAQSSTYAQLVNA